MRIIFFSDHFRPEPSAPAAHVYERAVAWARDGHDVTVITSAPNFPEGRVYPGYRNRLRCVERMDGIRVLRVGTFIAKNEGFLLRTIDYASYMVSAFLQALFEPRPHVVISSSPHMFVAVAGVAYARLKGVPHVVEVRDLWPASIRSALSLRSDRMYRVLERLELWIYRHSTRVLSLTNAFVADMVARGVPASKVDVVINGANLSLFSPRSRDPDVASQYGLNGRFVVGYLGTIGLAHALHNVLNAALRLRDLPVSFFFVGVGAARQGVVERARELKLDNVVFAPRQLKEDMPRFWSVCDVGLVHLKNDKLFSSVIPSKIFESMAMGVPVLYVGPSGEGSDLVLRHAAGIVVAPEDPPALEAEVRRLFHNSSELRYLAEASLKAAPNFSRERHAAETLRVLEKALRDA
jgi:colanic acid biosynthesis glycosyl transferase WcaI